MEKSALFVTPNFKHIQSPIHLHSRRPFDWIYFTNGIQVKCDKNKIMRRIPNNLRNPFTKSMIFFYMFANVIRRRPRTTLFNDVLNSLLSLNFVVMRTWWKFVYCVVNYQSLTYIIVSIYLCKCVTTRRDLVNQNTIAAFFWKINATSKSTNFIWTSSLWLIYDVRNLNSTM